jgi:multidrug efflux pump subunit AcrA (membrane-fusion protein)
MGRIFEKVKQQRFYIFVKNNLKKLEKLALMRPFVSLFVVLAILLVVIAFNSYLGKPQVDEKPPEKIKQVSIYSVGESPRIQASAKVEESNVITVIAQAGGIVQSVSVKPGQRVGARRQIIGLSSNYYGGSAATIQRQLAQVQNKNVIETFDAQKDSINKQKDLANLKVDNADELRKITEKSIGETRDLLELNETMLAEVNADLETATVSATISGLNAQKAQLLAGMNQIKSGLRQAEYQGDKDNPPFQLAVTGKDATLKQLALQEKSLEMSKEISDLQLKLARVQEATMYPATPFAGIVERVFVKKGQSVSKGTPLATIKADRGSTQLIALVSQNIAAKVNITEPTYVTIAGQRVEIYPDYVSTVGTDSSLYSVVYSLESQYQNKLNHNTHVSVSIPVGSKDTNSIIPFLPLEAVHQSELESTVFVLVEGQVESQLVELGTVSGRFVEIKAGLSNATKVILNKDVIEGQKVEAEVSAGSDPAIETK